MADGSPLPRACLPRYGWAGGHCDVGAPHLAVVQPPEVHRAGARFPVQFAGQLHIAEPAMVKRPSSSSHR
jgi:hypothetical protein